MKDEAKALAQALYNTKQSHYSHAFAIPETEDVVIAMAVRKDKRYGKDIDELMEMIKAMPQPSGTPCPMCGGTGRV